jgi:hypothetical protein
MRSEGILITDVSPDLLALLRIWDPLDLVSGIGFSGSQISYPGPRIPNTYFREPMDTFLGKKYYNSLSIGSKVR